jgi:hypothetical protein
MEFLNQNMQLISTIATVLGVLLGLMIAWRLLSPRLLGRRGQRLGVIEYREIDRSRRLVLVRRDQTEHLLLIGGHTDARRYSATRSRHCASPVNGQRPFVKSLRVERKAKARPPWPGSRTCVPVKLERIRRRAACLSGARP